MADIDGGQWVLPDRYVLRYGVAWVIPTFILQEGVLAIQAAYATVEVVLLVRRIHHTPPVPEFLPRKDQYIKAWFFLASLCRHQSNLARVRMTEELWDRSHHNILYVYLLCLSRSGVALAQHVLLVPHGHLHLHLRVSVCQYLRRNSHGSLPVMPCQDRSFRHVL